MDGAQGQVKCLSDSELKGTIMMRRYLLIVGIVVAVGTRVGVEVGIFVGLGVGVGVEVGSIASTIFAG